MEAIGDEGEHEEAQSDANGQFRLRALQPGRRYQIHVKQSEGERVERASPPSIPIQMGNADVKSGVEFIVFRRSTNKADLTGVVETSPELLPTLTVRRCMLDATLVTTRAFTARLVALLG